MERLDSRQYFDTHADRILEQRMAGRQRDLTPFLSELPTAATILDWGCGPGVDLARFAWEGHRVIGIDQSNSMIEIAKKNCPKAILHNKNGLMMTAVSESWDGFWVHESFNYLPFEMAQRVVAIAFQGLKSGGILGIIVKQGSGFFEDRSGDLLGPSRMVYLYGEKQLCSMIEQTGFRILRVGTQTQANEPYLFVVAKRID
jgi:SAM-dependent methyltransferase